MMKKKAVLLLLTGLLVATMVAFPTPAQADASPNSCWGQASSVFAQMGVMGEHSSSYDTPRIGLRNLARQLYDAGLIEDDSMRSLGVFVASALDLSIEACQ
jgi:hypothetical protein